MHMGKWEWGNGKNIPFYVLRRSGYMLINHNTSRHQDTHSNAEQIAQPLYTYYACTCIFRVHVNTETWDIHALFVSLKMKPDFTTLLQIPKCRHKYLSFRIFSDESDSKLSEFWMVCLPVRLPVFRETYRVWNGANISYFLQLVCLRYVWNTKSRDERITETGPQWCCICLSSACSGMGSWMGGSWKCFEER
jgi:hypothetical protein